MLAQMAAVFLLTFRPAGAQQADTTRARPMLLDPVVITAERRPTSASDAVPLSKAIEGTRLTRRAASDVTVVLREIPGLQLDPVVGSGAGITIQGLGSDRVLLLAAATRKCPRLLLARARRTRISASRPRPFSSVLSRSIE